MNGRTPNICVTCNLEVVRYGIWTEPAAMVPLTYVSAVARAGGRPLLIAPTPHDLADAGELLGLLDGVLVTGGADVGPGSYGAERHPETDPASADRDAFELALVRAAAARDLPCLGVCRGMQIVNVAYGGTLDQHLADRLDDDVHRGDGGDFSRHEVDVEPGSLAALAARRDARRSPQLPPPGDRARRDRPERHRPRGRATRPPRPSRTRPAASCSACCGIPRRTRRTASSASFVRECAAAAAAATRALTTAKAPIARGLRNGRECGAVAQPVKRGEIAWRAQRRNVSGSRRALVPLPLTNCTRATTRWRPKP